MIEKHLLSTECGRILRYPAFFLPIKNYCTVFLEKNIPVLVLLNYNSPSIHPSPVELTYSTVYRPSQEPEPTKKGSNSWLRKATELKYWYIKMLVDLVTLVAHQDLLNVVIGGVGLQLVQPVLNFLKRRNRSILRFAYRYLYWDHVRCPLKMY